jgi:hypothetical protein
MKNSLASLYFTGAFFIVLILTAVGLNVGGRIPFVPSKLVHQVSVYWTPSLLVFGWILMLVFHRDPRDPLRRRKLVEFYSRRGIWWTSGFIFLSGLFFYFCGWLGGDAGIQKSAVFLSGVLPSKNVVVEMPIYGIRDFSSSTSALKWVKIDNEGHVTSFSYPASQLTFLPCANDRIRVSGSASWAGIRVNHVECSPPTG